MVIGKALRCPLHGRAFDGKGASADAGRAHDSGQPAFPCIERFGLVFAFHGGVPSFPLPFPVGIPPDVHTSAHVTTMMLPMVCVGANAFDTAHLSLVHGRELIGRPEVEVLSQHTISIGFTARVSGDSLKDRLLRWLGHGEVRVETTCWGGNLLIFHHRRVGTFTVHAALPVDASSTTVFTVSGRASPRRGLARARERLRLAVHHRAVMSIVRQDETALAGLSLSPSVSGGSATGAGTLDPLGDHALTAWLEHFHALPRSGTAA